MIFEEQLDSPISLNIFSLKFQNFLLTVEKVSDYLHPATKDGEKKSES